MGYHEHSNTWTPIVGEVLRCQIEPENDVDKYAAAVMNKLQLRASRKKRKVSKNSILFLRVDVTNSVKVTKNGKTVNRGKGIGMEVPYTITLTDTKSVLSKLKEVV